MNTPQTLYLLIPCYNEEEALPLTAGILAERMSGFINEKLISAQSKIVFIDDGSKDKTWSIISELHGKDNLFSGIRLSRNRGHQNALLAGLMTVKNMCDFTISMDADLQDDIEVLKDFITKYYEGNEIVYGVRSSRKTDSFFKRWSAESFYKLMRAFGADIVYNHADYRLASKKVLQALDGFQEVNLFLRGLFPLIGFKTTTVYYERKERTAGKTHYPLSKMIALALNGITSLSVKPLRFITTLGLFVFIVCFVLLLYVLINHFTGGKTVDGWSSIIISIWGLGGLQLFSIGVIGEYVGKIYLETKHRPRFIIYEILN
ncbi:MAG: glycosyltransferase family 2 protein [Spirochaetaceae bacterium]|nr:glycosyltransferase family 2 protein [Spirochaetaceae bacterium]